MNLPFRKPSIQEIQPPLDIVAAEQMAVAENPAEATLETPQIALAHQRPDGVAGDWVGAVDPNVHQRLAEWSNGWLTRASGISLIGGLAVAKGLWDISKGHYVKGVIEVGVGRYADVKDGDIAKKDGTRGKTGALVDSGIDKLLTIEAIALPGVVDKKYATVVAQEQVRIVALNAMIQKAGGEPNPSKSGKFSQVALWGAIIGRTAEKAFRAANRQKAADTAGRVAAVAEVSSLGLMETANVGYVKQYRTLKKNS